MLCKILDLQQQDDGSWLKHLECGHSIHCDQKPACPIPPWITLPDGQAKFVGLEVECPHCEPLDLDALEDIAKA